MMKKYFITAIFLLVLFQNPIIVKAVTNVNLFQVTNTPYQETHPQVYGNMVAYTTFGGTGGVDIWAYNIKTKTNFPLIEKPDQQWVSSLYKDWVVYEDFDETTQTYDIRLFNLKTKKDLLITPGASSYSSGGTNGKDVVYLDGGACGMLMVYNLKSKITKQLASGACTPKISGHWVIWNENGASGPGIYGYDLVKNQPFEVNIGEGFADTININKNKVVWMIYAGSRYRIMMKDLVTNSIRTLLDTTEYYVNYPAASNRYVVWGKSLTPGQAGVEGINLKTGQIFEVYPQGTHQNTNLAPVIWNDISVWQAWRTGNGDIYGATLENSP